MMLPKMIVIGVGIEGRDSLSKKAHECISDADELWGSTRLLEAFSDMQIKKVKLEKVIVQQLQGLYNYGKEKKVVFLASGDPAFHGLGSTLLRMFPEANIQLIPQPSLIQEAFAAAGVSWEDAVFISAHNHPIRNLSGYLRRWRKAGILCGPEALPHQIAAQLSSDSEIKVFVFSEMGTPVEQRFSGSVSACREKLFPHLSVMLVIQADNWIPVIEGETRDDNNYAHLRGLITKEAVRQMILNHLRLQKDNIVWDIGAGSGAVSIEASERAWQGQVFAIERNAECLQCIYENKNRFAACNVEIIGASAPEAFVGLPIPDAVFIGGSGGNLSAILNELLRLHTHPMRIVASFVILENLCEAAAWFNDHNVEVQILQTAFSDASRIGTGLRFVPQNPVYILSGELK